MVFRKSLFLFLSLVFAVGFLPLFVVAVVAEEKSVIHSAAELPRHTYTLSVSASALLQDDTAFQALADQVKQDLVSDLNTYDIRDPATLKSMGGTLINIALLQRDYPTAKMYVMILVKLDNNTPQSWVVNLLATAEIRTRESFPSDFSAAFAACLTEILRHLPYQVVEPQVKELKARLEVLSEGLLLGMVKEQIDPVVAATAGVISLDLARQLLAAKKNLDTLARLRDIAVREIGHYLEGHRHQDAGNSLQAWDHLQDFRGF